MANWPKNTRLAYSIRVIKEHFKKNRPQPTAQERPAQNHTNRPSVVH